MTPNKEDYLKRIYELSEHNAKITNKEIAAQMDVSPPAVSEMIKKMIHENWITKDKQKGYLITEKGMVLISSLYRKHRLIELFLIKDLGYSEKEVHEEAEILEHSVSDKFIDRLEKILNFPETCPHGGSIPRKNECLNETYTNCLTDVTELGCYSLKRYHDHADLLNYLEEHNFHLLDSFELIEIDDYTKTMTIISEKWSLTLPHIVCQELFVEKHLDSAKPN
ncbi:metal-dependent transcriptional regulator [Streptococcus jiangjianxini]|uniref:metal-dependent transcriptional regulator n=1 Tax=Streptococcus jiangjianxini TaxID=3161189 RepID=UPI0032EC1443